MLLNVWDQWQESGFSVSWTYEHFIQVKVGGIGPFSSESIER